MDRSKKTVIVGVIVFCVIIGLAVFVAFTIHTLIVTSPHPTSTPVGPPTFINPKLP